MPKKVVILGGGVAGMSAAHELVERGFAVEVFERQGVPGGKARSIEVPNLPELGEGGDAGQQLDRPEARSWLPGEHGFRFFPRFYKHVVDTMGRIPYGSRRVADNLVDTARCQVARFDQAAFTFPARFPRTPGDMQSALLAFVSVLGGELGIPLEETAFFGGKMWQLLTSCEERRFEEYEKIDWWDFVGAETRSPGYQKFFANGITRSLVAAKAERASTKTIGDIFLQIMFDILEPGASADRVLNGPTSEVWIGPWLKYLKARGVIYHLDAEVQGLDCGAEGIRAARIRMGGKTIEARGDYFVAALPVERMAKLLSPDLLRADPSLENLQQLKEYVEWMNGIQFYLTEDVPITPGHTIYLDSPWALTSVSQPQFWPDFAPTQFGDGRVRGIISVDISDWDVKGLNGKCAEDCTRDEIAAETWEQMKRSLNVGGQVLLRDECLLEWYLDPAIVDSDVDRPGIEENMEPLLVNYVDTWKLRPEAVTRIANLFLASDYVRTYTDLATMEAANEAARRAVNGVLIAARSSAAPCELWNLTEPEIFIPWRAYDRVRFRQGLPWDAAAVQLAHKAIVLGANVAAGAGAGMGRT